MTGVGGVGQTSLALHWLHQAREGYPGGQLGADLGAFRPGEPVSPGGIRASNINGAVHFSRTRFGRAVPVKDQPAIPDDVGRALDLQDTF